MHSSSDIERSIHTGTAPGLRTTSRAEGDRESARLNVYAKHGARPGRDELAMGRCTLAASAREPGRRSVLEGAARNPISGGSVRLGPVRGRIPLPKHKPDDFCKRRSSPHHARLVLGSPSA
jgi:hypothetical protein